VLTAMIALAGPASARLGIAPSPVSQDDAVIQVCGAAMATDITAGMAVAVIITVGSGAEAIRIAIADHWMGAPQCVRSRHGHRPFPQSPRPRIE
jgi:hypothetical protein